jgi:hypothetical protein
MLVRKRELPALKKAQADLDKQIQMPLFVM